MIVFILQLIDVVYFWEMSAYLLKLNFPLGQEILLNSIFLRACSITSAADFINLQ